MMRCAFLRLSSGERRRFEVQTPTEGREREFLCLGFWDYIFFLYFELRTDTEGWLFNGWRIFFWER